MVLFEARFKWSIRKVPEGIHAAESQEQAATVKEECWACGRTGNVHYTVYEYIGNKYGITRFDLCCTDCQINDAVKP